MDRVVTKERSHILRRKIFNLCAGRKKREERKKKESVRTTEDFPEFCNMSSSSLGQFDYA